MERRTDLLDPLFIVPLAIILFFSCALYAYEDPSISPLLDFSLDRSIFFCAGGGTASLIAGIVFGKRYRGRFSIAAKGAVWIFLSWLLSDVLGIWGFPLAFFLLLSADLIRRECYTGILSKILLATGIVSGLLCFRSLGGIPLLDMTLRGDAHNGFFIVSFFSSAAGLCFSLPSLSRRWAYVLLLSFGLFFSLFGYRNDVFEMVACGACVMYYTRKLSFGGLSLLAGLFLSVILLLGSMQIEATGQAWRIDNPVRLLLHRAGFTLGIFSEISKSASLMTNGMGALWHVSGARPPSIVGMSVAGYSAKINSTIFGPSLFDGGALELILVFLLVGFILGCLHGQKKNDFNTGIYAFALAMILGTVEIGLYYYDMIMLAVAFFLALPRMTFAVRFFEK